MRKRTWKSFRLGMVNLMPNKKHPLASRVNISQPEILSSVGYKYIDVDEYMEEGKNKIRAYIIDVFKPLLYEKGLMINDVFELTNRIYHYFGNVWLMSSQDYRGNMKELIAETKAMKRGIQHIFSTLNNQQAKILWTRYVANQKSTMTEPTRLKKTKESLGYFRPCIKARGRETIKKARLVIDTLTESFYRTNPFLRENEEELTLRAVNFRDISRLEKIYCNYSSLVEKENWLIWNARYNPDAPTKEVMNQKLFRKEHRLLRKKIIGTRKEFEAVAGKLMLRNGMKFDFDNPILNVRCTLKANGYAEVTKVAFQGEFSNVDVIKAIEAKSSFKGSSLFRVWLDHADINHGLYLTRKLKYHDEYDLTHSLEIGSKYSLYRCLACAPDYGIDQDSDPFSHIADKKPKIDFSLSIDVPVIYIK